MNEQLQVESGKLNFSTFNPRSAFTLVEMLAVITILGILAGLAVPALKNIGKADANIGATQQLLDDFNHARQLAIRNHTTVYMIFVPANFWLGMPAPYSLALTNLADKQLTGYTYVSHGGLGDQPGQHNWHYLEPWQNLPEGTFIAQQKFSESTSQFYNIASYNIYGFQTTNNIPFPTETTPITISTPYLPYIAFNYLGQLTTEQLSPQPLAQDEYIPLARGSVTPAMNVNKQIYLDGTAASAPSISEIPPGNSTSSSYNIIEIDWLTGRATLKYQKVQ